MKEKIVVGVGGAGCNIANQLGAFLACDVLLVNKTGDLPGIAGACLRLGLPGDRLPTVAAVKSAVEEVAEQFRRKTMGKASVILTVGLGGVTGSGAAPTLARLARSAGLHLTAVATLPFSFETDRRTIAESALDRLWDETDVLLIHDHAAQGALREVHESLDEYFGRMARELSERL